MSTATGLMFLRRICDKSRFNAKSEVGTATQSPPNAMEIATAASQIIQAPTATHPPNPYCKTTIRINSFRFISRSQPLKRPYFTKHHTF